MNQIFMGYLARCTIKTEMSEGETPAIAGICALVPCARWLAHHELALALHVRIRPAPRP